MEQHPPVSSVVLDLLSFGGDLRSNHADSPCDYPFAGHHRSPTRWSHAVEVALERLRDPSFRGGGGDIGIWH